MAEDNVIHYSDFIQEDGSIDKLISKLSELSSAFSGIVANVKAQAKELQDGVKGISTKTAEGRRAIAYAAQVTSEYDQITKMLNKTMTEVSKQMNVFQNKLVSTTGLTDKHKKSVNDIGNSYVKLESEVKGLISFWSSLNKEERQSVESMNLVKSGAQEVRSRLGSLAKEINTTVREVTALRDAQEKLNFMHSEEGKKLIQLQQQLKAEAIEINRAFKEEQALIEAKEKLRFALSEEGKQLAELNGQIKAAQEHARLLAIANNAAAGSYDQVFAKYRLAQNELRAMSDIERLGTEGQAKQAEVNQYRVQIVEMENAEKVAVRLKQAELELQLALSDTGKQLVELRTKIANQNQISKEAITQATVLQTSYDELKNKVAAATTQWQSLTEAERTSAAGTQLADSIVQLKAQLAELDSKIKVNVQSLTELEKAEQRLAFLRTDEGKRLVQIKEEIAKVTASYKEQKEEIDKITQAEERLAAAKAKLFDAEMRKQYGTEYTEDAAKLKSLQMQEQETQKLADLVIKLNNAKAGSYNEIAAQYEINKIKLNAMSAEERNATDAGKKLEEETLALYKQMIHLQEATGNYKLSLGNYKTMWNGLQNSVTQVVRELPAAAVSLNTFFLGISNNIPILIDEIQRLKEKNEMLRAEGRPTKSVMKEITSALLSWQSAVVVLLLILSTHGQDIIDWFKNLFKEVGKLPSVNEQIENIGKAIEKNNGNVGDNTVKLKKLSEEWQRLSTKKEQLQFIRDNETAFKNLGIAITDVSDAENAFVDNTDYVIRAVMARARAAAAEKLAAEEYEKALRKTMEAEREEFNYEKEKYVDENGVTRTRIKKTPKTKEQKRNLWDYMLGASYTSPTGVTGGAMTIDPNQRMRDLEAAKNVADANAERRIENMKKEADATMLLGDAYFELANAFEEEAKAELAAGKIKEWHRTNKTTKGREPRDLTDIIYRNDITIQRRYEQSITKLTQDEYLKRRQEANYQVADANRQLEELYRKNVEYVNNTEGKYKELTEEQRNMIAQQQAWIKLTIANNLKQLGLQLQQIEKEQMANSLKLRREAVKDLDFSFTQPSTVSNSEEGGVEVSAKKKPDNLYQIKPDLDALEASLLEERNLMMQSLNLEYQMVSAENQKLIDNQDASARSQEEILLEYNKKALQIYAQYDELILNSRKNAIDQQLKLVEEGTQSQLNLLLKQNEIARKLALQANAAKPAEEQISSEDINAEYDKNIQTITINFETKGLEKAQMYAKAAFDVIKHNSTETASFELQQDIVMWDQKIKNAKQGYDKLDSQAKAERDKEIQYYEDMKKAAKRELSELNNFISQVGKKGFGEALLTKLGFDDDQIDAISEWADKMLGFLNDIAQAEVDLAEKAVEAAQKRVDAAQSAYDKEVEARNNGYANNVATSKKELQLEKKNLADKQKELERAQRNQERIQSLTQASSLITASANIWSSLSSIPIIGPTLAIAMIGTMWSMFAASKIKAKQVTAASQEYGEGGLEFLEGGSHASGNDIDLHTKNSEGKNMRAEGGEAMAIINKRNTRKYRKVLPDIINSINKGTFENKYLKAFENGETLQAQIYTNSAIINLSKLEDSVEQIRRQGETQYIPMGDGSTMIITKNVRRIVR